MDKVLWIPIMACGEIVQLIYRRYFIENRTFGILTCSIQDVTKDMIHLFNYLNSNGGPDILV